MDRTTTRYPVALATVAALLLAACAPAPGAGTPDAGTPGGASSPTAPGAASPTATPGRGAEAPVGAELTEYEIGLDRDEVPAGETTFEVTNAGTIPHEFLVILTPSEPGELPVSGGTVDTSQLEVVAELDPMPPGATTPLTANLEPSHYVVICNIPGHYEQGMHAGLDVGG